MGVKKKTSFIAKYDACDEKPFPVLSFEKNAKTTSLLGLSLIFEVWVLLVLFLQPRTGIFFLSPASYLPPKELPAYVLIILKINKIVFGVEIQQNWLVTSPLK